MRLRALVNIDRHALKLALLDHVRPFGILASSINVLEYGTDVTVYLQADTHVAAQDDVLAALNHQSLLEALSTAISLELSFSVVPHVAIAAVLAAPSPPPPIPGSSPLVQSLPPPSASVPPLSPAPNTVDDAGAAALSDQDGGGNAGVIAGSVVGGVLFFLLVVFACVRRHGATGFAKDGPDGLRASELYAQAVDAALCTDTRQVVSSSKSGTPRAKNIDFDDPFFIDDLDINHDAHSADEVGQYPQAMPEEIATQTNLSPRTPPSGNDVRRALIQQQSVMSTDSEAVFTPLYTDSPMRAPRNGSYSTPPRSHQHGSLTRH